MLPLVSRASSQKEHLIARTAGWYSVFLLRVRPRSVPSPCAELALAGSTVPSRPWCIRVYNRVGSVDLDAPSCVQCGSCGGRWAGPALEQLWSGLRAGREPWPQTLMSAPLLMPRHHQVPSAVCGEGLQSAAWLGRAPSLVWGLGRHARPLAVSSCSESCSLRGRRNQGSPLGTPRARPAPRRAQ